MKTIFSFFVALLIMISAHAQARSSSPSPLGMSVVRNGNILKVFYKGESSGRVHVAITNARGKVVFRETLHRADFVRPYNISGLPEGEYEVSVSDEGASYVRSVNYVKPSRVAMARLKAVKGSDRYMLTIPRSTGDPVTIRIFDNQNELLYAGTERTGEDFGKLYKVEDQKVVFEISDNHGNVKHFSGK